MVRLLFEVGKSTKKALAKQVLFLARRTGFEPVTLRIGIWYSIQLSYRRIGFDHSYSIAHYFPKIKPFSKD